MRRLDRTQRIAVLAGLAAALWFLGHAAITIIFSGGWIAYAPLSGASNPPFHWTLAWQTLVQLGIWFCLIAAWVIIAIRTLRPDSPQSEVETE